MYKWDKNKGLIHDKHPNNNIMVMEEVAGDFEAEYNEITLSLETDNSPMVTFSFRHDDDYNAFKNLLTKADVISFSQ